MEWMPIETAPCGTTEMFVARGFHVTSGRLKNYTTDPYCVWQPQPGVFPRWPHPFPPTHFVKLPTDPKD